MWTKLGVSGLAPMVICVAVSATAQTPLSAIDWLSDSLAQPAAAPFAGANEPPVTRSAAIESVTVQPLDAPSPDGIGLLPRSVTGLPADLWGASQGEDIARAISAIPTETLPAIHALFHRIALAELAPPQSSLRNGALFQARIDALLTHGAVEQAGALLDRAGSQDPELFRRSFDIALLTQQEDRGCDQLRATPGISASFPVRIFCLARTGDWSAAALTLRTAEALGQVTQAEDTVIARFLDPDLFEGEAELPRPRIPTPLIFRMMAAVGEPIPTNTLPIAFAHADLHSSVGWKARVLATERLVRVNALPANALLGVYTERKPSASGASWDRIKAVQVLEKALDAKDNGAVAAALPSAWNHMVASDLAETFATLYGARLLDLPLTAEARSLSLRIGLLSEDYERAGREIAAVTPFDSFAASLAQGLPALPDRPTPLMTAIANGFADPPAPLPLALSSLMESDRAGEALLHAMALVPRDAQTDPADLTAALALLRMMGLEDIARRVALQLLLRDLPA